MSITRDERQHLRRLGSILQVARRGGVRRLNREQLEELPRLYRFASSLLARLESSGREPGPLAELRPLLLRAHGILHGGADAPRAGWVRRAVAFFLADVPRAIRAEWKMGLATFALVYGLAAIAYALVMADLGLAYSLLDPHAVDREIGQLRGLAEGEAFRGNFTFGPEESSGTAGAIMGNNLRVSVIFFALGLVPPLYLFVLAANSLMLGTYTAVAAHWGQAGEISSILWCHGVLEIQAIVLAGTAGLVLLRAWVAPGAHTRAHALRVEARRAFHVFAATVPMLFAAGLIEGFVSPHAPFGVRIATAVGTGVVLVAWITFGGRRTRES